MMRNWMPQRRAILVTCLGLFLGLAAAQESFGTCPLSMSEEGECRYNVASGSNGTLRGYVNDTYVPLDIGVSLTPQLAPKTLNNVKPTAAGSIRARASNDNIIKSHWGKDQTVGTGVTAAQVREVVDATQQYMSHTVFKHKEFHNVRKHCTNQHASCSQWAAQGECQANAKYMQVNCAPACQTCEMLDVQNRCPIDPAVSNAWGPGDLNRAFERITTNPFYSQQYGPLEVLSRPHLSRKQRNRLSGHNNKVKEDGPWLVSLDNFLTLHECERLIELGAEEGYEPSSEVGNSRFDGTRERIRSKGRTSYSAWCREECEQDETVQRVLRKLHNLTGIPQENLEHLQLVRYEHGQQYATHYDFNQHETGRPQGGRILTIFLYLNDATEGGETEFTGLNHHLAIAPKRGKALIWPNVLDHAPDSIEVRTKHRALPVKEAVKYGVNAWFHQRDFRAPHSIGCTV